MIGFGPDWTEKITAITNRATYTALDALPSGGTDWFTRIREGESDYASISIVGEVTTNVINGSSEVAWGEDMHNLKNNEGVNMELVGDHTWRYRYYVPTNRVGERIRFHFEGVKYVPGENVFSYAVSNDLIYANTTNAPTIPYTVAATGTNDIEFVLDDCSTHILIEYNDAQRAFTISHAMYQNFNTWTDAIFGYHGDSTDNGSSDKAGISDAKERYDAKMGEWDATSYSDPDWWREPFDIDEDDYGDYPVGQFFSARTTPNGWSAANGMYVERQRIVPVGRAFQMQGQGLGSLSLENRSYDTSPRGVGEVRFAARVAQTPDFGNFAYAFDNAADKTYAISAKVTMSQRYDSDFNPTDISPSTPSVSLVGYLRGQRDGCYEFRVTRTANRQMAVALYRWKNTVPTLLVQNIVGTTNHMATGQSGYGVGKVINSSSAGDLTGYAGNMLVPVSANGANTKQWTCMCFSLFTSPDQKTVYLDGYLSTEQNTSDITQGGATKTKRVVAYVDTSADRLTSGAFGVGSVGCQAGFGRIIRHNFVNDSDHDAGINLSGLESTDSRRGTVQSDGIIDRWDFMEDRWNMLPGSYPAYRKTGLQAVIPTNQTVKLMLAKVKESNTVDEWIDSGWETNVTSFATNTYLFSPCLAPTYRVRLQSGGTTEDVRTDIVIDDVEVTAWRGEDTPDMLSLHGIPDDWVYTMASIETAAEIAGSPFRVFPAGNSTNGYVFVFTNGGSTVTFTPNVDMVIDRALLVGGGGAGGNVMGGGGGGGQVRELDWTAEPITIEAGTPFTIVVGGGGAYDGGNNQNAGKDGGTSRLTFDSSRDWSAVGGGGGGGWSSSGGHRGASGGGGSNRGSGGAATAGNSGSAAANGRGGGGGGAGEPGGECVLGWTDSGHGTAATRDTSNPYDAQGGKGGDGVVCDITGRMVYYGGGGGGGAGWDLNRNNLGGDGGVGGGGAGARSHSGGKGAATAEPGAPGTGGGGGGGGGWNGSGNTFAANRGGAGGSGCVILRVRTASMMCVLQPMRNYPLDDREHPGGDYPMSLRSPFMERGLSVFSFSYRDADEHANLLLQICTNLTDSGASYTPTIQPATDTRRWTTVTNWSFAGLPRNELASGTLTHFMSLRAPHKGMMRLVMDPLVVSNALSQTMEDRDLDYGKITITKAFCYDEPELDARSWWGWNMHTRGWTRDAADYDMRWAYLNDSPSGLSCSLNFSALKNENEKTQPPTAGIGLWDLDDVDEYSKNNPFVQSPVMTNGITGVSFRARTFETNSPKPSVVILYGSKDPDAYQPDPTDGQSWKRLYEFVVTNPTYQTYSWTTNLLKSDIQVVRLEVGGARWGRYANGIEAWETPSNVTMATYTPIQRVFLDEITVYEPVAPRLKFFDVRPFRSGLDSDERKPIANINSKDEQPLLNESWGIQARVEPQQLGDELDMDTMELNLAVYVGYDPWGYENWKDIPESITRYDCKLTCVDSTNHIYRSTYDPASRVLSPVEAIPGRSYAVVQYHLWATYRRKGDTSGKTYDLPLSESDWKQPEWYWPKDLNREYGFGNDFSAYAIMDTISPGRAWLNEVNYFCPSKENYQFIEFAAPEHSDLTGWRLRLTNGNMYQREIATIGSNKAKLLQPDGTNSKEGSIDLENSTNGFVMVSLATPTAEGGSLFPAGTVDGYWDAINDSSLSLNSGKLNKYEVYGMELIRPSGVIEHQIVTEGTNDYIGTIVESDFSGTNITARIRKSAGADSKWFFVGNDLPDNTLGVFRGHGEEVWNGGHTWTNDLTATPGELNLRNGVRQEIDEYMTWANGTNVWIYANVRGQHAWQYFNGDLSTTNRKAILIVRKGDSTNIMYKVDAWYQLTNCTVTAGNVTKTVFPSREGKFTFKLNLENISDMTTVNVNDAPDSRLHDYIDEDSPYKPAIVDWLLGNWPDSDVDDFKTVECWLPTGVRPDNPQTLSLLDMYLMDIAPVEDGWVLLSGLLELEPGSGSGGTVKRFRVDDVRSDGTEYSYTNSLLKVRLLLTNTIEKTTRLLSTIQGMEPGSSSAQDYSVTAESWTGGTFKVTGAVYTDNLMNNYLPLRWFVFDDNSFFPDGTAYIEIPDQTLSYTPGAFYGWGVYPGVMTLFQTRIDGDSSGVFSTEMLRKIHVVHTNELPDSVISP